MKYATTINNTTYIIEINDDHKVILDGIEYSVDFESVAGQPVYSLLINGHSFEAYVAASEDSDEWQVLLHGELSAVLVEDEREKRLRQAAGGVADVAGEYHVKAPMPGLIVAVQVTEGQVVAKGDLLIILESMKMQNELKCPRAGTISRVRVKAGEGVEQNQQLITIL